MFSPLLSVFFFWVFFIWSSVYCPIYILHAFRWLESIRWSKRSCTISSATAHDRCWRCRVSCALEDVKTLPYSTCRRGRFSQVIYRSRPVLPTNRSEWCRDPPSSSLLVNRSTITRNEAKPYFLSFGQNRSLDGRRGGGIRIDELPTSRRTRRAVRSTMKPPEVVHLGSKAARTATIAPEGSHNEKEKEKKKRMNSQYSRGRVRRNRFWVKHPRSKIAWISKHVT